MHQAFMVARLRHTLQGYLSVCTFVLCTSDIAHVIHSISSQQNNGTMIFSDIINSS